MYFEKKYVLKNVLEHLEARVKHKDGTSKGEIFNIFEEELRNRNKMGTVVEERGNTTHTTSGVPMPNADSNLINEVIWDLIIQRVLTPWAAGYVDNLTAFSINKQKLQAVNE
ncbi:hypothetical protein [Saccharibacillus brassicae]|uniref:Uncharacterized protein n=1 Tax=Saccharibacillus brassicae TaxID=2583377 RepID=A0A4Y6UQA2_SACBS|nr:hypothetical protein [Saccharibacillus brassicae]QDH19819.1 hypothetical protein FFV09_02415 [Saccharibacillus brassicae]